MAANHTTTGGDGSNSDFAYFHTKLVNGGMFTKHGDRHKPHQRRVWASENLDTLNWAGSDESQPKQAPASAITDVLAGWHTPAFNKLRKTVSGEATSRHEACCFSLVFSQRTLDLEVETPEQRDKWIKAFSWLKQQKSQRGVGLPFNVRHNAHVDLNFEWSGEDLERDFLLTKKLGEGSFGEVYECVHRSTGFLLAAKLVLESSHTPEKIREIREEAEILKKCRNSNIVNFFGCWGPDKMGNLWIMMQLCDGGSLNDILERGLFDPHKEVFLSEEQIGYIAQTSLKALMYLHVKNIIHRDIKAGNILLTRDGDVKLTDFGISKVIEQQVVNENEFHMPAGSPLWMSPELLKGAAPSTKADIWALGITMIELAEAEPPLFHLKPLEVMQHVESSPPPTLTDESIWSPEFVDFVHKCLILNPDERPSALELMKHPFVARPGLTKELLLPIFDTIDDENAGAGGFRILRRMSRAFQDFRRRSLQGPAMSKRVMHRKQIRDLAHSMSRQHAVGTGGGNAESATLNIRATMSLHRTMDLKKTFEINARRTLPTDDDGDDLKEVDTDLVHYCEGPVFGQPLRAVTDQTGEHGVPRLIEVCTFYLMRHGLEEPGLFRVNGDASTLHELRAKIDRDDEVDIAPYDVHIITGLMKLFLRMLPEPLLTFERYQMFVDSYRSDDFVNVSRLAEELPSPNKETFRFLLVFLSIVAQNENKTHMSPHNLAMVFSPNMLRSQNESPEKMAADSNVCIGVVRYLILEEMRRLAIVEGQVDEDGNETTVTESGPPPPPLPDGGDDDDDNVSATETPRPPPDDDGGYADGGDVRVPPPMSSSQDEQVDQQRQQQEQQQERQRRKSSKKKKQKKKQRLRPSPSQEDDPKSSVPQLVYESSTPPPSQSQRHRRHRAAPKPPEDNDNNADESARLSSQARRRHNRRMSEPSVPPIAMNVSVSTDGDVYDLSTRSARIVAQSARVTVEDKVGAMKDRGQWSQSVKDFKHVQRVQIPGRVKRAIIPRAKNIRIGDRMQVTNGRFAGVTGVVSYVGKVHFGPGPWVGLKLDTAAGNSDGSKRGRRYFRCDDNCGIFVKSAMLRPMLDANDDAIGATAAAVVTSKAQRSRRSRSARGDRGTAARGLMSPQYGASRGRAWKQMTDEEEAMIAAGNDDEFSLLSTDEVDLSRILPPPQRQQQQPASLFDSNTKRLEQLRQKRDSPKRRGSGGGGGGQHRNNGSSSSSSSSFVSATAAAAAAGVPSPIAEDDSDAHDLLYAAEDGDRALVMQLLGDHPEWIDFVDDESETPLHKAARSGHDGICSILVRIDVSLLEKRNREGQTALCLATMAGHVDVIRVLILKGADPNVVDNNGAFPLFIAAGWSPTPIETLKALFSAPHLNFRQKDRSHITARQWAERGGKHEIAALLKRGARYAARGEAFPSHSNDNDEDDEEEDEEDLDDDDDDPVSSYFQA